MSDFVLPLNFSSLLYSVWYSCHELGLFSLFLSLSLSPGPCLSILPHLFIIAISACAASVTPVLTCLITFSLLLASVSLCSLSDYFVCTWVMLVCYAIYLIIYPVLSCLIKPRGVALVLCAFVSLSSCCVWPRTRTVFLPYEKFQLCCLSSRQESSFTEEFIYFVFVPVLCFCSTDCLCLLFIKSHSELTFAPGSSVSSDRIIRPRWIQRRKVLSPRRSSCRGPCSVGMKRSCLSPDTLWRVWRLKCLIYLPNFFIFVMSRHHRIVFIPPNRE